MAALVSEIRRALPNLRASEDDADRVAYSRDLWPRHHLAVRSGRPADARPGAIVWPTTTEEVQRLVQWARGRGVALAPFGGGSGVCAGILPNEDMVVVDLKRMRRVREIDAGAPSVEVEAGAFGVPLERALGAAGFTLGHFPSSILCSTVGGWVAARSAGQCSGRYGKIEDMVVALECVTGAGDIVRLQRRTSAPDLVPLVVGSEGTLAIVTAAKLRLHPAPTSVGFGAFSFPTTRHGWQALRALFQGGLRPAVARLYDPVDAFLAKHARSAPAPGPASEPTPGAGGLVLRALLRRPRWFGELIHTSAVGRALGGARLVLVFEGDGESCRRDVDEARRTATSLGGNWLGEEPARHWLERRYAVSYRQAPLFANGLFVDTMEVSATWSSLENTYLGVRRALGRDVLVTAHFSHPYPDGCCVYFTFAGCADAELVAKVGWDRACEATYDRAWRRALDAATRAGGTLAHHHGVGRSKAPRLSVELGAGVGVVRALMRAFDPAGILNPGNLLPLSEPSGDAPPPTAMPDPGRIDIDRQSLLASIGGGTDLATAERTLNQADFTLDLQFPAEPARLADWLAAGTPGARDRWLDPVDQLLAGFCARLIDGRCFTLRPAPRRAVGPDLTALFVGAGQRFGVVERAWLRIHRRGLARPTSPRFDHPRDPTVSEGERALLDSIERSLRPRPANT
jgi:alkyldihydroxyacetonephosphate synthase